MPLVRFGTCTHPRHGSRGLELQRSYIGRWEGNAIQPKLEALFIVFISYAVDVVLKVLCSLERGVLCLSYPSPVRLVSRTFLRISLQRGHSASSIGVFGGERGDVS